MLENNFILDMVRLFFRQMGAEIVLERYSWPLSIALLVVALLCCFLGYKLYRVFCAFFTFVSVAIGIDMLLSPYVHKGVVVTAFAIVGMIAAFLAFQWQRPSSLVLAFLFGLGIAYRFIQNLWICAAVGVVAAMLAFWFPVHVTVALTSVYGGLMLGIGALPLLYQAAVFWQQLLAGALCILLGILVQFRTNRSALVRARGNDYRMLDPQAKTVRREKDENGHDYQPKLANTPKEETTEDDGTIPQGD